MKTNIITVCYIHFFYRNLILQNKREIQTFPRVELGTTSTRNRDVQHLFVMIAMMNFYYDEDIAMMRHIQY